MDIATADLVEVLRLIDQSDGDGLRTHFAAIVRRMGRERVAGNLNAGHVLVHLVNRLDEVLRDAATHGEGPQALAMMDLIARAENAYSTAVRYKFVRDVNHDPTKRDLAPMLAAEVIRRFPETVTFLPDGLRRKVEAMSN